MTIYASPSPGPSRVPISDIASKLDKNWIPDLDADTLVVADAGDHFTATEVEGVLQEVGDAIPTKLSIALAPGAQTVDSVLISAVGDVEWAVNLSKSGERYSTTIRANHNGTTPFHTQNNVTLTDGTIDVSLDVDISAGALRLRATASSSGWAAHIRRMTADA